MLAYDRSEAVRWMRAATGALGSGARSNKPRRERPAKSYVAEFRSFGQSDKRNEVVEARERAANALVLAGADLRTRIALESALERLRDRRTPKSLFYQAAVEFDDVIKRGKFPLKGGRS